MLLALCSLCSFCLFILSSTFLFETESGLHNYRRQGNEDSTMHRRNNAVKPDYTNKRIMAQGEKSILHPIKWNSPLENNDPVNWISQLEDKEVQAV